MQNHREIIEALEVFSHLLIVHCLRRAIKVETYDCPTLEMAENFARKALQEDSLGDLALEKAKIRLLELGFSVPDSWLLVDTCRHSDFSRTRKKKQPFQVRIEGPDTAPIHAILGEIRIAIMRLRAEPTTQSIQQNLTDLQKEAYKLIRDEGPLLGKTIAVRLEPPNQPLPLTTCLP